MAGSIFPGAEAGEIISFDSRGVAAVAADLGFGETLQIKGVPLAADRESAVLLLERVRVFAPDALIVIHGEDGDKVLPPPANTYLRGQIAGTERSMAFVTVRASGEVRGLISDAGRYWVLGSAGTAAENVSPDLMVREIDAEQELPDVFRCGTEDLPDRQGLRESAINPKQSPDPTAPGNRASYTARVAVETDWEYYQQFGNTTDATDYIGDLIGYASGIYDAEIDTTLWVSHVSLWDNPSDPWTQTGSTLCALLEYGRYWNINNGAITRSATQMLSGKPSWGGIAWVDVLCWGSFNTDHQGACPDLTPADDIYGGAYSFVGSIDGAFNINNPAVIWDIQASAHELGHNFGSRHTHCYAGIGGNPNPVDECYNLEGGCYSGTPSLPCAQGPGFGCGTIMSYCHQLSGGMSNITLTFGTDHPHGEEPERVPELMSDSVVATAAANPSCLALINQDEIFSDGFENGHITDWSASFP